jgi:1-aminocyclopropane-1-carboxylate synthase
MTPGRDCKCKTPGCFRLCFAAVPPKTLEVAAARLKALLEAYE